MTTIKKSTKMSANYDSVQHIAWTTYDEEKFIDELGEFRDSLPRPVLLAKYINFMTTTRVNFARMDKGHLIEYAKKALKGIK